MMYKHPELEEVDPKLIEKWYSGLNCDQNRLHRKEKKSKLHTI